MDNPTREAYCNVLYDTSPFKRGLRSPMGEIGHGRMLEFQVARRSGSRPGKFGIALTEPWVFGWAIAGNLVIGCVVFVPHENLSGVRHGDC